MKPVIQLADQGFLVSYQGKVVKQLLWRDVLEIVTYKVDLMTTDCICLGFRISPSKYLVIHEEMDGWGDFINGTLKSRFPSIDEQWWGKVMKPAFFTNWTTLYGEPLSSEEVKRAEFV